VDAVITDCESTAVSCLHGAPFQISQVRISTRRAGRNNTNQAQPVQFVATHGA